jgi:hypothetical protein
MKEQHKENFWCGKSALWRKGCPNHKFFMHGWLPVVLDATFTQYVYTIRTKLCKCHSMNIGHERSGDKNQYAKSLKK